MGQQSGIVVAALILGAAVLAAGWLVREPLLQGTEELAGVRVALGSLEETVKTAAPAPPRQAARPSRPDPDKVYKVNTKGAPALGPEVAQVEVIEFGDFQ
jgi:hypothetical protein